MTARRAAQALSALTLVCASSIALGQPEQPTPTSVTTSVPSTTSHGRSHDVSAPAPGLTRARATVDEALRDAQRWVLTADSGADYSTPLIARYLSQRYGWRIGALQLVRAAQGVMREPESVDWGPLIGAPFPATPRWGAGTPRYTWVPAAALRCHMTTPTTNLDVELTEMLSGGGYTNTHATLAWVWMTELGCETDIERAVVIAAASSVVAVTHPSHDLGLEARAMLALVGGELTDEDVQGILDAQRPGGWWGTPANRYHATILASLALLAHRGEVLRDISMTFLVPRSR
jgi:hypothetical protein